MMMNDWSFDGVYEEIERLKKTKTSNELDELISMGLSDEEFNLCKKTIIAKREKERLESEKVKIKREIIQATHHLAEITDKTAVKIFLESLIESLCEN